MLIKVGSIDNCQPPDQRQVLLRAFFPLRKPRAKGPQTNEVNRNDILILIPYEQISECRQANNVRSLGFEFGISVPIPHFPQHRTKPSGILPRSLPIVAAFNGSPTGRPYDAISSSKYFSIFCDASNALCRLPLSWFSQESPKLATLKNTRGKICQWFPSIAPGHRVPAVMFCREIVICGWHPRHQAAD